LPTEAEWEYACRAGTRGPFSVGSTLSSAQANYDGRYPMPGAPPGRYLGRPAPVGSFPPNPWGLYDMHGNVWEWCEDWYGEYPLNDVVDPQGANADYFRVLRGGSGDYYPEHFPSASLRWIEPGRRYSSCGFRLCFCLD